MVDPATSPCFALTRSFSKADEAPPVSCSVAKAFVGSTVGDTLSLTIDP